VSLDDEKTEPHEPAIAIAWREHEKRVRRFFITAVLVTVVLGLLLVVAGTIVRRAIELAPVVNNASTSCLTVCCRPFNVRTVSK